MTQVFAELDVVYRSEIAFSEAAMHLGVAGKEMNWRLSGPRMVQLLRDDGTEFSFPITRGEAGVYEDEQHRPYFYVRN